MRRVFVLALSLTILLPLLAVLLALAAGSSQAQCGGAVGPVSAPGVPSSLLAIYEQAAGSYQLGPSGWAYLAAINEIETNFGHDLSTSSRGAIGWMQFMPATWAQYQVSADPAKPGAPPDPDDPWDAIFAAARYLNASGAPGDWQAALYAYNHAGWYVAQAQQLAQHYAQTAGSAVLATGAAQPGCVAAGPPHQAQPRGSSLTGSPPSRRPRPRRYRPRSRPATGSSTPPIRKSARRTCSAPSWAHTTAQARPTSCSTTPA